MMEANIYIKLLEGAEILVPVPAISHGNDIFEVKGNQYLDLEDDATSIWEFFPGDMVKCLKPNKSWIASELLGSTFPNRKLYQLIFLIVESLGKISLDQLQGFENELQRLCVDRTITQRQHPVIEKWLHKIAPSICD